MNLLYFLNFVSESSESGEPKRRDLIALGFIYPKALLRLS
jgi:hypothetical protein